MVRTVGTLEFREIGLADVPVIARLPRPGEAGGDPPDRMARYLRGEHHPHLALLPRVMWVAWDGTMPAGWVMDDRIVRCRVHENVFMHAAA